MQWFPYEKRAFLRSIKDVHDGDSLRLSLDLGFYCWSVVLVRLYGVDTPELNSPDPVVVDRARVARDRVRALLPLDVPLTIETLKAPGDRYGRWLAKVYLPDGRMLNDLLVEEGLAKPYDGGPRA